MIHRLKTTVTGLALIAMSLAPVSAQDTLRPSPHALPAIQAPAVIAQDGSCAGACQTRHDQCRVQTKGSPSCDTDRQRCLQACLAAKKR